MATKPDQNGNGTGRGDVALVRVSHIIQLVLGPLLLAIVLFGAAELKEHSNFIAETRGNRFTSGDAYALETRWGTRLTEMMDKWDQLVDRMEVQHKADLASLERALDSLRLAVAELPKKVPPQWFLDDFTELKGRVTELERQMRGAP